MIDHLTKRSGDGRSRSSPPTASGFTVASMSLIASLLSFALIGDASAQSSVRPPAGAVENVGPPLNPNVRLPAGASGSGVPEAVDPTGGKGAVFDTEMWRRVRQGVTGSVSIPDKKAGQLVQSDGEAWRSLRNGPLARYGGWAMGATLVLLALFFLVRGRIRIDHGWSGRTIQRFTDVERTGHWLLAVSFIVLGLSGLNVLYGRYVLEPILGKPAFAALTFYGKLAHNYVAFAFMVGLALTFLLWIRHNFPNHHDVIWLVKGGGMFVKGSHPPSRKFNAGQKILFWLVMLGGVSISLSGLAMMFPFQAPLFAKTFAILNGLGMKLPTTLTPMQEMQYATTWHAIVSLVLVCVVMAHIYIGTLGMQGAYSAMGSGEVDENWAREHHNLWAEEALADRSAPRASGPAGAPAPAE